MGVSGVRCVWVHVAWLACWHGGVVAGRRLIRVLATCTTAVVARLDLQCS